MLSHRTLSLASSSSPLKILYLILVRLTQNLNVSVDAIVNDASAAVLARAYVSPSTRLAVILGTGINAAVHLPIASLHPSKFGARVLSSTPAPTHVLVNCELSMFGRTAYTTTRWDDHLNKHHVLPDYQPLEYLIAGGYMGEIVRLVLLEAIDTAGLFRGSVPPSLATPYCIDTRALAAIELDLSPSLTAAAKFWTENFPTVIPIAVPEIRFVRDVVRLVSRRSLAYFTASSHALASMLQDTEREHGFTAAAQAVVASGVDGGSRSRDQDSDQDHISIGCEGSVVNKYPGFIEDAQELMDKMVGSDAGEGQNKRVVFERTSDSAVLGAGVAVAMACGGDEGHWCSGKEAGEGGEEEGGGDVDLDDGR